MHAAQLDLFGLYWGPFIRSGGVGRMGCGLGERLDWSGLSPCGKARLSQR
jgi:hypothetical protein